MKFFKKKVRTNFHDEGLLPKKTLCLINSVILNDSIYQSDKSYYSQIVLNLNI